MLENKGWLWRHAGGQMERACPTSLLYFLPRHQQERGICICSDRMTDYHSSFIQHTNQSHISHKWFLQLLQLPVNPMSISKLPPSALPSPELSAPYYGLIEEEFAGDDVRQVKLSMGSSCWLMITVSAISSMHIPQQDQRRARYCSCPSSSYSIPQARNTCESQLRRHQNLLSEHWTSTSGSVAYSIIQRMAHKSSSSRDDKNEDVGRVHSSWIRSCAP